MTAEKLTITVEEAGKLLGISRSLAYTMVRTGKLRSLRIGRRFIVPKQAIDELLRPPVSQSKSS